MPSGEGAIKRLHLDQDRPRPLHAGEDSRPRRLRFAVAEEEGRWVLHLLQSVMTHLEHADLVGRAEAVLHRAQDAELVAAMAFEIEHGVDHVLDHLRARDLTILGDMADENERRAALLGVADERRGAAAKLGDGARRGIDAFRPERLHRIDHDEARGIGTPKRGDDIGEIGLGAERDRRLFQPEPLGAHANLRRGLLAGKIDDRRAGIGEARGGLQQQRGFADAGIAADKDGGAGDEAAAGDAVEFAKPGSGAGRVLAFGLQGLEGDRPPFAAFDGDERWRARR